MPLSRILPGLLLALLISSGANAKTIELTSPVEQATLLELYTSEGCSSCPPADRWLSKLKKDQRLWQKIVPVAFHVDYWDYLGWRDRFSDAKYSQRQYNYKKHRNLDVVYTPGLMKNGREFRGWNRGRKLTEGNPQQVGVLKAVIDQRKLTAEFVPAREIRSPLKLNIALLGFDQTTKVAAGENGGKKLVHDFVVLELQQHTHTHQRNGKTYQWQLDELMAKIPTEVSGIALWVTSGDDLTPIQATGGWL